MAAARSGQEGAPAKRSAPSSAPWRERMSLGSRTVLLATMRAEDATALAMIISELVQNAVEHGLADRDGKVEVAVTRQTLDSGEEQLTVVITDDGVGLPAGFRPSLAGLGTRIVTSLATDLKGRIRWENNEPSGTRVEFVARLRPLR